MKMEEQEKLEMWLIGELVDDLPNSPMPTNGQLLKSFFLPDVSKDSLADFDCY
jgi:hypothetical protein